MFCWITTYRFLEYEINFSATEHKWSKHCFLLQIIIIEARDISIKEKNNISSILSCLLDTLFTPEVFTFVLPSLATHSCPWTRLSSTKRGRKGGSSLGSFMFRRTKIDFIFKKSILLNSSISKLWDYLSRPRKWVNNVTSFSQFSVHEDFFIILSTKSSKRV